jgi:hypothetical protein
MRGGVLPTIAIDKFPFGNTDAEIEKAKEIIFPRSPPEYHKIETRCKPGFN